MTPEEFQKLGPREQSRRLRKAAHKEFCILGTEQQNKESLNRMFRCLEEATRIEDAHGLAPWVEPCKQCDARKANGGSPVKVSLTRMVTERIGA